MMELVSGRVGGGRRAARARSARLGCATRKIRDGLALGHLFAANGRPPRGVRAGGNVGGFAAIGRVPAWRRWSSRQTCRVSGACMSGSPTAVSAASNGHPCTVTRWTASIGDGRRRAILTKSKFKPSILESKAHTFSDLIRILPANRSQNVAPTADCSAPHQISSSHTRVFVVSESACEVRNNYVLGMQSCCCAREKIRPTSLTRPPRPPPWRA